jgi:hypothetical protein
VFQVFASGSRASCWSLLSSTQEGVVAVNGGLGADVRLPAVEGVMVGFDAWHHALAAVANISPANSARTIDIIAGLCDM